MSTKFADGVIDEVMTDAGAPVAAPQGPPKQEEMYTAATRHFDGSSFPVGTGASQGDFYLFRIDKMPKGAKASERRRLAMDNTPGSRHDVVIGDMFTASADEIRTRMKATIKATAPGLAKHIKVDDIMDECFGPVFCTTGPEGKETAVLEHPEHGHHVYEGEKMVIVSIAQRTLDSMQKIARMRD